MDKIREAFGFNLRLRRGNRTQAQMAEFLEMPLRTYQRLETGEVLAQEATLEQVTSKLGVSEISLVQLPQDEPRSAALLREALALLPALNDDGLEALLTLLRGLTGTNHHKPNDLAQRIQRNKG